MERVTALNLTVLRDAIKGPIGQPLYYYPSVDSTNRLARDLQIGQGAALLTDYQFQGRGRRGRSWEAPAGSSVLCTVVLQTHPHLAAFPKLAALSVADAIIDVTGLSTAIKWPNDILVNGKKVAGILVESLADRVLLGMGINVNFDPASIPGIPPTATTLSRETGGEVSREDLIVALFKRLGLWYGVVTHDDFGVDSAWAERLDTLGRAVAVLEGGMVWKGQAVGVQRDGALVVRGQDGHQRAVYAADVSLRDDERNP